MFILIPMIIVFLCSAYIYTNEVGVVTQIFLYSFMGFVVFLSLYLYKKIQQDLKQQEINKINQEIQTLTTKLNNTDDKNIKNHISSQIKALESDINDL